MYVWLRKLFVKPITSSQYREPPQHDQVAKDPGTSVTTVSASSSSSFTSSSHPSLSSVKNPTSSTKPPRSALRSPVRWTRKYDVCVCHSSVQIDIEEAIRLVSFLEASPRDLRCFLWPRDSSPGAAIPTELCQAVQNSHCMALLITPNFLQDDWCKYMMNQVLAEGPMSNRMIPLIQNLPGSLYPLELKFYYYIDLSKNPDRGYTRVNATVLKYLEDIVKREDTLQHGQL